MKKIALINDLSAVGRCSIGIALPVLATMGFMSSPLPTAVLSSHTGYPEVAVRDLSDGLAAAFQAWQKNGFHFDAVLSGYLGAGAAADSILAWLRSEREERKTLYFLDPVMADHGRLYRGMGDAHITAFRDLLREADYAFPNLTEACLLADFDYQGLKETLDSCETDSGRLFVLQSLCAELQSLSRASFVITGIEAGDLLLNCVSEPGKLPVFLRNPRVGGGRAGTGDLFAAVTAGRLLQGQSLQDAAVSAADFIEAAVRHSEAEDISPLLGVQFEDILGMLRGNA